MSLREPVLPRKEFSPYNSYMGMLGCREKNCNGDSRARDLERQIEKMRRKISTLEDLLGSDGIVDRKIEGGCVVMFVHSHGSIVGLRPYRLLFMDKIAMVTPVEGGEVLSCIDSSDMYRIIDEEKFTAMFRSYNW